MSEASKSNVNGNKPNKNKNKGNNPNNVVKTKVYHSKANGKRADISMIEMQPLNTLVTGEQSRVFNNDTQKSMCVKNKVGTSGSQVSTGSSTTNVSKLSSSKHLRRKQNRNNKRRNLAKQHKDEQPTQFVKQTNKLDDLKSLIDVLALTIESQTFSLTSLNKYWLKFADGMNVMCTCGKRHYPFNEFCDLEDQVKCTYNYLIDLLELSVDTPQISDRKHMESSVSFSKTKGLTVDKSLPAPDIDFSFTTDEESNEGRPECVYEVVPCSTPPGETNAPRPRNKQVAKCAMFAEQLIEKLNKVSASDMQKMSTSKVIMKEDKDMGQFVGGNGTVKRVRPEIATALGTINETYMGKFDKKHLKTPISRPVINNLVLPKVEERDSESDSDADEFFDAEEEVRPKGFKLQYKPAFWQFWRHKSTFNSESKFNHDAHFVRQVAKSKNLDHTNLPDDCVIDSLYSYLIRRRLPTYPTYNAKLEHLHKLAKAWESEEMPLSKNTANATQLNNYYLTIGKVANSTDIDVLLSQHHEDNLGRRQKFIRWITGRTVQTIRED